MKADDFWKHMIKDEPNLIERAIGLLDENGVKYCVIGGQAVSAYVEPVISLDLDLAVATDQIDLAKSLFEQSFWVRRYEPFLSVTMPGSDFRVQIQTDPRCAEFVERAESRQVMGMAMPVASLEDIFQSKIWAAQDPKRRASKRQKDLADIARLMEVYPHLRERLPEDTRSRLIQS
jgi:nucleotidyltransferase AbiEii toxin of type IV toxin-antitoxin system